MVTTGVSSPAGPPAVSPVDPYAFEPRHRIPAIVLLIVTVLGLAGAGVVARRTTAGIATQRAARRALPPNLPLPAVDDFGRPDTVRLGRAASGQPWVQLRGRWGIRDGRAVLLRPAAGEPSLALLRTGAPGGTVTLDAANPVAGAGLAFRCRNARNCWFLEAVPEYGTWNILRTVDGRRQKIANLGVVPVAPGTLVSVAMAPERLTFFVDGTEVRRVDDSALGGDRAVGLVAEPGPSAEAAEWGAIRLQPAPPVGVAPESSATLIDRFDGPDSPGSLGAGWTTLAGSFGIDRGRAVLERGASPIAVSLRDTGSADGIVEASLASDAPSAGLAFRCRDARNCWYVVAIPYYAAWNVYRLERGVQTFVAALELAPVGPGTTVAVRLAGPRMDFYVDGQRYRTIRSSFLAGETRAGIVRKEETRVRQARWRLFMTAPSEAFAPPRQNDPAILLP
jgi:hypothetical protein